MVGLRLVEPKHELLARRVSQLRNRGIALNLKTDDFGMASGTSPTDGLINVKITVGGVARMERQAEQSLLIVAEQIADRQEQVCFYALRRQIQDSNSPSLLDHEKTICVARWSGQKNRPRKTRRDQFHFHRRANGQCRH